MSDEFEGVVGRVDEQFTEEALKAQNGKRVPLRLEIGGPVIGEATLRYESGKNALMGDFLITDPEVAEFLKGDPPSIHIHEGELVPEMRYYTVRQEREVKVTATSAINAARIADAAFETGQDTIDGEVGRAITLVRVRDIDVREDI